ncbi:hypothetical protein BZA70DRAFT_272059 [Myxozyma melibiosi]|uniref:BHLH domain-containing protein n=1 Tax=Myxozyma melibiosi TaxID=54550 RepID=A0ABR1FD12_9ASCO
MSTAIANGQQPSPTLAKRKHEDGSEDPNKRQNNGPNNSNASASSGGDNGNSINNNDVPLDPMINVARSISASNQGVVAMPTSTSASTVQAQPHMPRQQHTEHSALQQMSVHMSAAAAAAAAAAHDSIDSMGQPPSSTSGSSSAAKPPVGSEEWQRQRRDNHKEVERRRRETINEGITELAKLVPNCEKNKGSILQRACQYIIQLKESEAANIEKWTLEKLLTEQAIAELSASNEKLKAEVDRAWREADVWKKTCASAGIKQKVDEN